VLGGQVCERAGLSGRDDGPLGPVDAGVVHRLADDEEVREGLRRRPGLGDDVDGDVLEGEIREHTLDLVGVDVVEDDVTVAGVVCERGGDGPRTERAPADADGDDGPGVGDRFDRAVDASGVEEVGQVQRRVTELVVLASLGDARVGGCDLVVDALEFGPRDARVSDGRQRVSDVHVHGSVLEWRR